MKKVYTEANGRVRVVVENTKPTRTQKQFKDQCDVNKIVAKYKVTGEWPPSTKQGVFTDVSQITDYHTMVNQINDANASFLQLPARIRARFKNDPGLLLEFLQDTKNLEEAIELGLVPAEAGKKTSVNKNDDQNDKKESEEKPAKKAKAPPQKAPDEL